MSGAASAYDRLAATYDTRWSRYLSRSLEIARAHLFANPGETLLDVGCGTGRLLDLVTGKEPEVRACGVDRSAAMLAVAQERLAGRARLIRADACVLPIATGSVDWLVSTSALHRVESPADALDEFYRVLRPGGQLLLVDWARDFLSMRVLIAWLRHREDDAMHVFTAAELRRLLAKASFEGVDVRPRRMTWTWGMLVATAHRPA